MANILPDNPDLSTFGGVFVDAEGVENPETEVAAAFYNAQLANNVAMSQTAVRAWADVASATLADHGAVWGSGAGVAPVVAGVAGNFTVTWATTYNDINASDPQSHTVNIRNPMVSASVGTATISVVTPYQVAVTHTDVGAAISLTVKLCLLSETGAHLSRFASVVEDTRKSRSITISSLTTRLTFCVLRTHLSTWNTRCWLE